MIDPGDRDEMIAAALVHLAACVISRSQCAVVLAACGMNATQIDEALREHKPATFQLVEN